MADVAQIAGVSHQTVSRVLNNPASVKVATRERVEAAMAELDYQRNRAARALARSTSEVIGIISSGEAWFGPTRALRAIEDAARAAGYVPTHVPVPVPADTEWAVDHLLSLDADGIVVIAPTTHAVAAIADRSLNRPVVLVAAGAKPAPGISVVAVDQVLGARLAVRHLAELGHTRIHHISGPPEWFDAAARVVGWREECAALGLREGLLAQASWDAADGYTAANELLDQDPALSAIFAANDLLALGATSAIIQRGARVPEDISVVGFDDIEGADYFIPALTTVRQPFGEVGSLAIETLLQMISGGPPALRISEPHLVVRKSTGRRH